MARFDRYLLSQLIVLFGFFALILVLVYWVNRAVLLFDQLIADGQSATVFLEFTVLTLPKVIQSVLPVAAFVASVYTTNRMSSESELVVARAMGFSGFRLARPVFMFGALVALLISVLAHFLVPAASKQLSIRSVEIADNITARFLVEGKFLHPADGMTFYIREITPQSELKDIFLSDARNPDTTTTYSAKSALIVKDENGPKLLMFTGMAQTLDREGKLLFTTSFADFTYDIGQLIHVNNRNGRSISELSTQELLSATPALQAETGRDRANLLYEGHDRFTQPLLAIAAALIGFSTLMVGNFSRFGVWRQILGATVLLIIVKALDNSVAGLARSNETLWPLLYAPALFGFSISAALLWVSERPMLFKRRARNNTVGQP